MTAASAAASVNNQAGTLHAAGGVLQLDVDGVLDNRMQGVVSSAGRLGVEAGTLDNTAGSVVAGTDLTVVTDTAIGNTNGTIQATNALHLEGAGLSNRAGNIIGGNVVVDTRAQQLDNTSGTIGSQVGTLDVRSGALNNAGGRLQSKAALLLQTNGQSITNTGSGANGGILAGGGLQVDGGALDNRGGAVFAQGDARIAVSSVDNSGAGVLSAAGNLALSAAALNNAGGRVQGGQAVNLTLGGTLDNQAGLVAAGGLLTLNASSVDNRNTRNSADPLGLQAGQLLLQTQALDNRQGQVVTDGAGTLQVTSSLDNTGGQISSGGSLDMRADAVANTAGRHPACRQSRSGCAQRRQRRQRADHQPGHDPYRHQRPAGQPRPDRRGRHPSAGRNAGQRGHRAHLRRPCCDRRGHLAQPCRNHLRPQPCCHGGGARALGPGRRPAQQHRSRLDLQRWRRCHRRHAGCQSGGHRHRAPDRQPRLHHRGGRQSRSTRHHHQQHPSERGGHPDHHHPGTGAAGSAELAQQRRKQYLQHSLHHQLLRVRDLLSQPAGHPRGHAIHHPGWLPGAACGHPGHSADQCLPVRTRQPVWRDGRALAHGFQVGHADHLLHRPPGQSGQSGSGDQRSGRSVPRAVANRARLARVPLCQRHAAVFQRLRHLHHQLRAAVGAVGVYRSRSHPAESAGHRRRPAGRQRTLSHGHPHHRRRRAAAGRGSGSGDPCRWCHAHRHRYLA
ncbi:hypothetical protein WCN78_00070 [Xanthomonas axonopodis pv. vasculorum]